MTVTRRSVLAATAAPAAGSLLSISAAPAALAAGASGAGGRRTVPLRDGWRFAQASLDGGTDPDGARVRAAEPGYDDTDWREVAVPHDWSIEQTPPWSSTASTWTRTSTATAPRPAATPTATPGSRST
ncbi:hypothetical protein [Streptomyces dangxiongensis]|uniref:hypothetical protein n=1 Tax=Streptomyces dangxiongensis TaxID=1442032 RepID=UPI0037437779